MADIEISVYEGDAEDSMLVQPATLELEVKAQSVSVLASVLAMGSSAPLPFGGKRPRPQEV